MALHDNPPHSVNTYTAVSSQDTGGGNSVAFTLAQSSVACSIDTASSQEAELFALREITVTHKVGFLASALTTELTPGMKLVTADRSESYHVKGIAKGRAYGTIPAFVYAFCESHAA